MAFHIQTGSSSVISVSGLLTTVAYQFGMDSEPAYALEGSVAIAGAAIRYINLYQISTIDIQFSTR